MNIHTKENLIKLDDNEKLIVDYKGHKVELTSIGQIEALNVKISDFSLYASQNNSLVLVDFKNSDIVEIPMAKDKSLKLRKFKWGKLFEYCKFDYLYPFVRLENLIDKEIK